MREIFVGILCALAIFLLCYKGPEKWDVLAARIAGAGVALVALLPTGEHSREAADTGIPVPDSVTLFSGPGATDPEIVSTLHYVSASVFFVTIALMSLLLFTKGAVSPTERKRHRNVVYRVCGGAILVAMALIALDKLVLGGRWGAGTSFVFWMEAGAVWAFGISWLTSRRCGWRKGSRRRWGVRRRSEWLGMGELQPRVPTFRDRMRALEQQG